MRSLFITELCISLSIPNYNLTRRRPKAFARDVLVHERITGMLNGNGKLSGVSTRNVCRSDGDVLLRTIFFYFIFHFVILPHTMNYKQNKNDNK